MELTQQVERAVRRGRLLAPGMRVAVACSGGADSVALLRLLAELKSRLGLTLLVVHLNHGLRGGEADADQAFVARLAEALDLEFVGRREDVAARARRGHLNLEEAGRKARLELFAALLADGRADAVALAHTLDDQAETVLARLLRGAGTRGLAGIHPVVELRGGRLVRPLLGVRRAALRDYLAEREQPWREDASNLDRARLRNRLRLEVLPQLARLTPRAVERLARLAEQARDEEGFWSALVEERFQRVARRQGRTWMLGVAALFEPDPLLAGPEGHAVAGAQRALARRLVRRALRAARGDLRRLTQAHVEAVLALAEARQGGRRLELPGVVVERRKRELIFRPAGKGRAAGQFSCRGASRTGL